MKTPKRAPRTPSRSWVRCLTATPWWRASAFFVLQTTVLTDCDMLADGGFVLGDGHTFAYVRMMANENNKKAREFL